MLVAASALLVLLSVYAFLLLPMQEKRQNLERTVVERRRQLEYLRQYDLPMDSFEQLQAELLKRNEQALAVLPKQSTDFLLITALSSAIKSHNINIRSIKIAGLVSRDNHQIQRLDCVLSGSYFEIVALLEYLQKRKPLTDVQISSITVDADAKLTVNVQVCTYLLQ